MSDTRIKREDVWPICIFGSMMDVRGSKYS